MGIPDYQSMMQPVLALVSDGNEYFVRDLIEPLALEIGLTPEEQRKPLPKSKQTVFQNRIAWAITYLAQARLLTRPKPGKIIITDRGIDAIRSKQRIANSYLSQFQEFQDFRKRKSSGEERIIVKDARTLPVFENLLSPDEVLVENYQRHRQALSSELLDRIMQSTPASFERLVVDLLVKMGYGGSLEDAGQAVGGTGDDGVDGIIKEDRLGLDFVYIQAKRWQRTVGRSSIQEFVGSLEGHRARKGVFITTSRFSQDAIDYVRRIEKRIVLIDGEELAQYMIDYGVGVSDAATYKVHRMDLDYFEEI